jgi:hypothetical protein
MRRTPPTENIPRVVYRHFRWRGRASSAAPARPVDAHSLFTKEYLIHNLIGLQVQGAYDFQLKQAMRRLAADREHATPELLEEIARLRGRNPDEFKAEYEVFRARLKEAYTPDKEAYEPLDEKRHPDFMGSETQLRYGFLVGQALGMDPVLGSMLNPTGGLVGPGNTGVDFDGSAVGYHGITHDAAGYLYNHHTQMGPGYNYLGREKGFGVDTGNPFTGQREGIHFWRTETPAGKNDFLDARGQVLVDGFFYAAQGVVGVVQGVGQTVQRIEDGVALAGERAHQVGQQVRDFGDKAEDRVRDTAAQVGERAHEVGQQVRDFGNKAEDRVRDTAAQVGERAHEVGQQVRDFGDKAEDRVRDTAAQVGERAHEVGQQVRDFGERAAERALDVGRWISRAVVERDLDHPWEM